MSARVYGDKLFTSPCRVITAFTSAEFIRAFEEIETIKNRYLLGYIRYEARDVFAGRAITSAAPLLYFEVFDHFEPYHPKAQPSFLLKPKPCMDFAEYSAAIDEIHAEIAQGNTYEVNYTYDYTVAFDERRGAFELYEYLLPKQKTPYSAFIENEYDTLLSFSPELFFRLDFEGGERHITTKPMKGTVRRGESAEEDARLIDFLRQDPKNRAENVMIVDLMRNDLGRVAKMGSVRVSRLFEVETHPTLHQLTSQIEADLKEEVSLYEIFTALFPCGSVTGAPKISTMRIIDRLEKGKRNIYCGAVGLIEPRRMTFSVPIRILQKEKGGASFIYRAGGAVVWDSRAESEWQETLTKARFLKTDFKLIETMKVENGRILFAAEHKRRLKTAAAFFDFPFDESAFPAAAQRDGIMRLLLDKDGTLAVEYRALLPCAAARVRLASGRVDSREIFLYYKTDYRPFFKVDYALFYDEIYVNERGELTEGSRTNIVVEIEGELWTPPVSSGLLNGIYRQDLLAKNACREKVLYPDDLLKAAHIYCVNSVRGRKEVELV
jgi:para-aminobenzoate synthetase/4-amino-4-deoxychorismate lyase